MKRIVLCRSLRRGRWIRMPRRREERKRTTSRWAGIRWASASNAGGTEGRGTTTLGRLRKGGAPAPAPDEHDHYEHHYVVWNWRSNFRKGFSPPLCCLFPLARPGLWLESLPALPIPNQALSVNFLKEVFSGTWQMNEWFLVWRLSIYKPGVYIGKAIYSCIAWKWKTKRKDHWPVENSQLQYSLSDPTLQQRGQDNDVGQQNIYGPSDVNQL